MASTPKSPSAESFLRAINEYPRNISFKKSQMRVAESELTQSKLRPKPLHPTASEEKIQEFMRRSQSKMQTDLEARQYKFLIELKRHNYEQFEAVLHKNDLPVDGFEHFFNISTEKQVELLAILNSLFAFNNMSVSDFVLNELAFGDSPQLEGIQYLEGSQLGQELLGLMDQHKLQDLKLIYLELALIYPEDQPMPHSLVEAVRNYFSNIRRIRINQQLNAE